MITKELYMNFLGKLLRDHYKIIKETCSASSDSQQFINGYVTAARKLNAFYQKELNDYIEMIHFEVFNMTIEQRKKLLESKLEPVKDEPGEKIDVPVKAESSGEDDVDIPAYRRKGVKLQS